MSNGNYCLNYCPQQNPLADLGVWIMERLSIAIFYLVVAGCAWRMLPRDFPRWKTVYHYFRAWRLDGTWERIHAHFVRWERVAQGREAVPSAASMDSQSVKTATPAAIAVGFDGGKRVKGRKRHLMLTVRPFLSEVVTLG